MGYIRHQGIIVTGSDTSTFGGRHTTNEARNKALELGLPCSEIVYGTTNGYTSFIIAPDGSKEGWSESTDQERKRAEWMTWAKLNRSGFNWACVSFGGDDAALASLDDWDDRET